MTPAFALAIASLVLGAELHLEGGVRTEGRSRTLDVRDGDRVTTAEVLVAARMAADLVAPDLVLRARYTPSLRAPDVLTSVEPDVLHAAELEGRLRVLPAWTLAAVAAGLRGRTDLLAESRRREGATGAVPTTERLRYVSARADLRLEGTLDPRTALTATAGAFVMGGDDAASRELLPAERGLQATAGLEWSATRRDVLALRGTGLAVRLLDVGTPPDPTAGDREAVLTSLSAAWRRQLTRSIEGRAGAGALASWVDLPAAPVRREIMPTAEAALAHGSEQLHLAEEASLRLGAAVDRLAGTVDPELEGVVAARWTPSPSLSFGARAAGTLVRREAADVRRGGAELRAEWGVTRHATLGLGLYGSWQRTPDPGLPSYVEGGVFGSVALEGRRGP